MRISEDEFKALPWSVQEQMLRAGYKPPKKKPKIGNRKTCALGFDGRVIEFDSAREAERYAELVLLSDAKEISDLRRQVEFELLPRQTRDDGTVEREVKYIADFVYRDKGGKVVVEDVKGYRDPSSAAYAKFVLKRKLMLFRHGITVKEV